MLSSNKIVIKKILSPKKSSIEISSLSGQLINKGKAAIKNIFEKAWRWKSAQANK